MELKHPIFGFEWLNIVQPIISWKDHQGNFILVEHLRLVFCRILRFLPDPTLIPSF